MLACVSLGTDPPISNHNPANFSVPPGTEKLNNPPPKQTKSPDNSNMLHMFNRNTYTDFRATFKHVLVCSYVTRMI